MHTKRLVASLALLASVAFSAPAVMAESTSSTNEGHAAPVPTVPSEVRASFDAFNDPANEMSPGAAAAAEGVDAENLGLNPDLAQAELLAGSSYPVWAVPGTETICVQLKDPVDGWAGVCAPTDAAIEGRLAGTLVSSSGSRDDIVYGLVPDDVSSVSIATADGAVEADVIDGFYAESVSAPTAVEITGDEFGHQTLEVTQPAG